MGPASRIATASHAPEVRERLIEALADALVADLEQYPALIPAAVTCKLAEARLPRGRPTRA